LNVYGSIPIKQLVGGNIGLRFTSVELKILLLPLARPD